MSTGGQAMRTEKITTAQGFKLHCTVGGAGRSLLLVLHGGPGGDGAGYLEPLHRLAGPTRTVVTFDQLGTGGSEVPPDSYTWGVEQAAADVDAVRSHFGAERVDVLGHSWGGMLALQYALDHPARVRRLVLSNTASSAAAITADFLRQILDLLPTHEAVAALTADVLADHGDPLFRSAVGRWLAAYSTNDDAAAALEGMTEALAPGPAGVGLWGDRLWFATGALRGWDAGPRLGEITAPTLILNGGRDMSGPAANRTLVDGIRDSEWITFNRNGHIMFDESNAGTCLAVVGSFLDGRTTSADIDKEDRAI
ncbi:alpha/beta fold hydrolase [Embleya scabrispora]|uniref:alpha/beta fold hydrolase n=1 Tax=Embleya scabrispora TaxID=159449 RepID=UPI0003688DC0|nr:alpha/beta fold hydrolase [Embleya scabrispora]MYS86916.1 alpha/beta fold hydrolase [Streptomyces sp. SID5474]